jgi:hypothetical protein
MKNGLIKNRNTIIKKTGGFSNNAGRLFFILKNAEC